MIHRELRRGTAAARSPWVEAVQRAALRGEVSCSTRPGHGVEVWDSPSPASEEAPGCAGVCAGAQKCHLSTIQKAVLLALFWFLYSSCSGSNRAKVRLRAMVWGCLWLRQGAAKGFSPLSKACKVCTALDKQPIFQVSKIPRWLLGLRLQAEPGERDAWRGQGDAGGRGCWGQGMLGAGQECCANSEHQQCSCL